MMIWKKQIENKQQEFKNNNIKKYLPNNEDVVSIKFINGLDNEEIVLLKTIDGLLLHNQTYEKYGYYDDWIDDDIPEELKNSDGIVIDETGMEIQEYIIEGGNEYINGKYHDLSYEFDDDICKDELRESYREVHELFDE